MGVRFEDICGFNDFVLQMVFTSLLYLFIEIVE